MNCPSMQFQSLPPDHNDVVGKILSFPSLTSSFSPSLTRPFNTPWAPLYSTQQHSASGCRHLEEGERGGNNPPFSLHSLDFTTAQCSIAIFVRDWNSPHRNAQVPHAKRFLCSAFIY